MLPRTRKKLHEKCTRHESTRVQLPFALQKQKREFQTRGDERAQKAPRESLFRRRSSSYLGQRPTAITGYSPNFQLSWNPMIPSLVFEESSKKAKIEDETRVCQLLSNALFCQTACRAAERSRVAAAEGVQTLQLCQTRQERKCIFATAAP